MKNWNTDTTQFKTRLSKNIWELSQKINYGLNGKRLKLVEIKDNWEFLKSELDPNRARMIEYLVWGKTYSLQNKNKFWNLSPKIKIYG
ncbi:hypothetical protein A2130_02570 [Candidatus Woesebacteria bacterium GWC2_33_12]|uniref:Uncharacterized protein n=1 Tax=Candidatus Woesebacteria bacterium GW2011_GWB1_33_22 TaxID=1618566 RepID=A0A0G0BZ42_9BACT|nr:MAG: hypothetical protein UR29_C0013G0013 [Candidatus Woesebacteria bacterium GW2011_GWC2_33_12]KKP41699.1 MAG: hypothetical protein UR33_C0011G0014 [Candidatus Woesebacteria bacterium GW2011_GWA2_33_20]KKP44165.1 MAG: hypothetical protein UR35_C0011G0051 [Candidatus Woesebacteria bacterium GW2011_GWB1_33_22]KKP45824.1 MAG: hypothetical protein UR37_C0014G0051 [Microgenomates group bacterium GW2011_GWC1_33_28]KKP50246.1 MAG: hypothetical protein UR41_C0010G0050 [Candidatus Woesebacteria bact